MERRGSLKQWLPNGKLLLLSLTKCHGVPCSLGSRIATKVWKNCKTFSSRPRPRPRPNVQDQDQDFMTQNQDQDFHFCPRGASGPRHGLEDHITGSSRPRPRLGHQVARPRPRPGQNELECTRVSRPWSQDDNTDYLTMTT